MRKLVTALAVATMVAGFVYAAQGYAGRQVKRMTAASAVVTHLTMASQVKVAAIAVSYTAPTTNTLYITTYQAGVTSLRGVVGPFTNATTIVFVPEQLWMARADTITISNAVNAAASYVIDYTY